MGDDLALLINNLRGAAKVEDIALFDEMIRMGFRTEQAECLSTNGKLLREAADALSSLERELAEARGALEPFKLDADYGLGFETPVRIALLIDTQQPVPEVSWGHLLRLSRVAKKLGLSTPSQQGESK